MEMGFVNLYSKMQNYWTFSTVEQVKNVQDVLLA